MWYIILTKGSLRIKRTLEQIWSKKIGVCLCWCDILWILQSHQEVKWLENLLLKYLTHSQHHLSLPRTPSLFVDLGRWKSTTCPSFRHLLGCVFLQLLLVSTLAKIEMIGERSPLLFSTVLRIHCLLFIQLHFMICLYINYYFHIVFVLI